jgi:Tfp pilus assembly PilM family ATPase
MPANEISSTEKLLAIIRQDSASRPSGPPQESGSPDAAREQKARAESPLNRLKRLKPRLPRLSGAPVLSRRAETIGIEIGANAIRIVKAAQYSETHWRLAGHKSVPVRPGLSREDPAYVSLLKTALDGFRDSNKSQVWVSISSLYVDIRNFRVPRVPKAQIPSAAYWGFKKETPFDEKQSVFDFEIRREVMEDGVPKLAVTAYSAVRHEVEELVRLFERAGYPLTGITCGPFGTQNLFRCSWMPPPEGGSVAVLYVGDERSRIDVFEGQDLVLTRGIKAGILSLVESLIEGYQEQWRVASSELPMDMFKDDVEEADDGISELEVGDDGVELKPKDEPPGLKTSFLDMAQARALFFSVTGEGPPLATYENVPNLSDRDIFALMMPAVERLVRQLERTLAHHSGGPGNERVGKIYVAGPVSSYANFLRHVTEQLGVACEPIDPLSPALPFVADSPLPRATGERSDYAQALCMALSRNGRTPNLLYTYEDKARDEATASINRRVVGGFALSFLAILFWYGWTLKGVAAKTATLGRLSSDLTALETRHVSQEDVLALCAKLAGQNRALAAAGRRYLPVVVAGELASLVPENVRLTAITTDYAAPAEPAPAPQAGDKALQGSKSRGGLIIEGVVLGDQTIAESSLAHFIMRLEASPLFAGAKAQKSGSGDFRREGDVLRFVVNAGVM